MSDTTANSTEANKPEGSIAAKSVDALINAAISKLKVEDADSSKTFDTLKAAFEIEKARAEASKTNADTAKVELDTTLAKRQLRIAVLSAMFAPLVPLASLLTVIVTLIVSSEQMRSANQLAIQKAADDKTAREEDTWKKFQDQIDNKLPDQLLSEPSFLSRIRGYASSDKYSKDLSDIEFQLMSLVSSDIAFKQLWRLRYTGTDQSNITQVLDLARAKRQQFDKTAVSCGQIKMPTTVPKDAWSYYGACSPKLSLDDMSSALTDPATLKAAITLKASLQDLGTTLNFLSGEISNYIKTQSNKTTGPKKLDISNVLFRF